MVKSVTEEIKSTKVDKAKKLKEGPLNGNIGAFFNKVKSILRDKVTRRCIQGIQEHLIEQDK